MSEEFTRDENRALSHEVLGAYCEVVDCEQIPACDELYHAHLHEHADGTVHNHFHRHPGGNEPHTHTGDHEHSFGNAHEYAHEHGIAHEHKGSQTLFEHDIDAHHDHDESVRIDNDFHVHRDTHESDDENALPEHVHSHIQSNQVALRANKLAFAFPRAPKAVFEDISFEAHAGKVTAILGNNGAGKSTLLNLLGNLEAPTKGSVQVCGKPLARMARLEIARHVAYVTQQQRMPHLTVYDEVLLGRRPHISWGITENDRAVVAAAIENLGLQEYVHRYCDELSGGERQKVYIARALAQETEVLLLDEPTSALDPKNQVEVLSVVREITQRTSLATIMVIHDVNLALRFADYFLLMRNGEVVSWGGRESVTDETLTRAYDMPMRIIDVDGTLVALS